MGNSKGKWQNKVRRMEDVLVSYANDICRVYLLIYHTTEIDSQCSTYSHKPYICFCRTVMKLSSYFVNPTVIHTVVVCMLCQVCSHAVHCTYLQTMLKLWAAVGCDDGMYQNDIPTCSKGSCVIYLYKCDITLYLLCT